MTLRTVAFMCVVLLCAGICAAQITLTDKTTGETRMGTGGVGWDCAGGSVAVTLSDGWARAPEGLQARVVLWLGFLNREKNRFATFCSNFDPKAVGIADTSDIQAVLTKTKDARESLSGSWEIAREELLVVNARGSLLRHNSFVERGRSTPSGVTGTKAVIERDTGPWIVLHASDAAERKYGPHGFSLRFVVDNTFSEKLIVNGGTFVLGTSFDSKPNGFVVGGRRYWYKNADKAADGTAQFTVLADGKIRWVRKSTNLTSEIEP